MRCSMRYLNRIPWLGSSIALIGRSNFANNSGNIFPQFSCSIDGIQIPNEGFIPVVTNNFVLCDQKPGTLVDGEHHFSLNITASPQLFYFDRLEYLASSSVSLSKATVKVNHTDPAISYSGNWFNYGNYVNMTITGGSKMTFNFIGEQKALSRRKKTHDPYLGREIGDLG